MQAIVEASWKPVAGLNDGEITADCFWETTIPVMICSVHMNLR